MFSVEAEDVAGTQRELLLPRRALARLPAGSDRRDKIELEQGTGRVRDITLTFTSIDFPDGRVLVVPNEVLMTTPLFNHSIDGTEERPAPSSTL